MSRVLAAVAVLGANSVVFLAGRVAGPLVLLAFAVLVWTSYVAGLQSRATTAVVVAAAALSAGARAVFAPNDAAQLLAMVLMFVVLPVLVGRYLAQHRRLVGTLDAHNRQLRTERALLAEREQLRERLRIARDVHDSLGRRLSIVSVRAAALEVGDLPADQREAVRALAGSARDAVTELYELVGSLRSAEGPGVDRLPALVEEFRTAGVPVTVTATGEPRPLPVAADQAAYRVVEEGLTNAAKHAAGEPVAVVLGWETDSLVVTVTNPVTGTSAPGGGFGLAGLAERVGAAGGFADHRVEGGAFRLVAMLPTAAPDLPAPDTGRTRTAMLGIAAAVVLFALLPMSMVSGVS